MSSRRTKLKPLLRWFAAATLLAWIGAQVACETHCLFGACHDESDDAAGHTTVAASHHHGDDDRQAPQPGRHDSGADTSCLTLKSALTDNNAAPVITPQFSLLYTLVPFTVAFDATTIEPVAPFSRQARPRDWVFTPEVSLGPAFRSHAPPISAPA